MNTEPEEIQYAEPLTVDQAIAHLKGEDRSLRFYAAWWFGKFKVVTPEIIRLLITALSDEDDRTPEGGYPLRRNAARALGKLGALEAVGALIEALGCSDYYVREGAAQSLEMLGDERAIGPLTDLLDHGLITDSSELIAQQPDASEPYDSVLEALGTLKATELQLRRAALMDVGAIGYLPAAEAISQTLAENSLKLISMKGLLEFQVRNNPEGARSAGAVRVMDLMDGML